MAGKAIIWTNDSMFTDAYVRHSAQWVKRQWLEMIFNMTFDFNNMQIFSRY